MRPLARTPITPNQVTTLRLATGLGAAACFAVGAPPWPYIASGVFVLSLLLDRADGILARLTGKTSAGGHAYDLRADAISNVVLFVGIGIGLRDSVLGVWAPALGVLAGLSVAAILALVLRAEAQEGERAAEFGGAAGFDPDDALLIVPLAVVLGGAVPLLVAAAIGAPAFALFFFWRFRRFLKVKG